MHRSLASMRGMPLLTPAGVRMGEIADAYFEPYEQRVLAFEVDWEEGTVFGPGDLLPITQLLELNAEVATAVEEVGATAGLDADLGGNPEGWVLAFKDLLDRPVFDAAMEPVGRLVDMHFDPQDGSVDRYEVVFQEAGEALMVPPYPGLEVRDGKLLVSKAAIEAAARTRRSPGMGIAFLASQGFEEQVGEDDLEVTRLAGTDPTPI